MLMIQWLICIGKRKDIKKMKEILGLQVTDAKFNELMVKQSQGGSIKVVENELFCLMPYENVENGELVDISQTPEYLADIEATHKQRQVDKLMAQIDYLDTKRIRAMAEPSLHPDGGTWIDYYTSKIQALRAQAEQL
jgi:hypothetical protein